MKLVGSEINYEVKFNIPFEIISIFDFLSIVQEMKKPKNFYVLPMDMS